MTGRCLTGRMKLNELHVLIRKAGPCEQCTAITGARMSRCAWEIATTEAATNSHVSILTHTQPVSKFTSQFNNLWQLARQQYTTDSLSHHLIIYKTLGSANSSFHHWCLSFASLCASMKFNPVQTTMLPNSGRAITNHHKSASFPCYFTGRQRTS